MARTKTNTQNNTKRLDKTFQTINSGSMRETHYQQYQSDLFAENLMPFKVY